MRIVVPATDRFSIGLLPAGPRGPIKSRIILKSRRIRRRVVKQTLSYAEAVRSIIVLEAAPQNPIDKLFILCDLFPVWLAKLLHSSRQPRAGATFIAEASNPNAAVLRHDLVCFAIVAHHGRAATKRIVGIVKPLLSKEEVSEVRNGLHGGFDHVIADGLRGAIIVSESETRATPRFATHAKGLPFVCCRAIVLNFQRALGLDREAPDSSNVLNEEPAIDIHRQNITGYTDRDWPAIVCECRFNLANLVREQKFDAVSFCLAGRERCKGRWVPWHDTTPFFFGKCARMDHPRKYTFECLTWPGWLAEQLVRLEWRMAVRN